MFTLPRARLGLLGVGAVVFSTVFAAAASLTVNTDALPQSGAQAAVACDADGVDVGYSVVGSEVTAIVISDDDCATGTITLETSNGYFFTTAGGGTSTKTNASTVTFTLADSDGGAATPIAIGSFDPGTVTVTLVPNP